MPKSRIDIDFVRATGIGSSGQIVFHPPRVKVDGQMLSRQPIPVDVVNGIGSVELVQLPSGLTYRAIEQIDGQNGYSYHFALPVGSPAVIQYEQIVQVDPVPATYTVVRTVNGLTPDPTTGNVVVEVAGTPGPPGPQGPPGTPGVLKSFAQTLSTIEIFGPCGDSGTWTLCPTSYRPERKVASVGDRILWKPDFVHQNNQEAAFDIASVIGGSAARYLSSGTSTPLAGGFAGLYMVNGWPRSLSPVWYTVAAEDLDVDGMITLALAYRAAGSGNMLGNAFIPGYVSVTNMGGGL